MRTRRRVTTSRATDAPRTSSQTPRSTGRGNAAAMEHLGLRTRPPTETQPDTEAPWTGFLDYVSGGDWLEPYCDHPDAVCRLQEFLQARSLYRFDIDGKFWDHTASGVRSFQGANGLETDAKVGPKTAAAIDRAMGGASAAPAAAPAPATEAAPEATADTSTWSNISALVADVGSLSRATDVPAGSARAAGVARIQEALAELGYASTDPSGTFGDATHAAVVSFQGDHGRRTDGEVGPRTAGSLDRALAAGATTQAPSSTTTPPPTELSTDAASTRALVLDVLTWSNQRDRYDAVYDQGADGAYLRDWMATHRGDAGQYGKRYTDASGAQAAAPTQVGATVQGANPHEVRAYPAIRDAVGQESGLGLEHVLEFIDSGGFDALGGSEQAMFLRAIQQVGSFYGGGAHQSSISNRFTWDPHGGEAQAFGSRALLQDADHVGRWECSSLAGFVRGDGAWLGTEQYALDAEPVDWNALEGDATALKREVPVGSGLVWRDGGRGHIKIVIGHLGAQMLIVEAQGSADFVHVERRRPTEMLETAHSKEYEVVQPRA